MDLTYNILTKGKLYPYVLNILRKLPMVSNQYSTFLPSPLVEFKTCLRTILFTRLRVHARHSPMSRWRDLFLVQYAVQCIISVNK